MSKQRKAERGRQRRRRSGIGWAVAVVAALAVVAVAGLVWLGQMQPESTAASVPSKGNVKGDPAAPVEVEEWGDFQ